MRYRKGCKLNSILTVSHNKIYVSPWEYDILTLFSESPPCAHPRTSTGWMCWPDCGQTMTKLRSHDDQTVVTWWPCRGQTTVLVYLVVKYSLTFLHVAYPFKCYEKMGHGDGLAMLFCERPWLLFPFYPCPINCFILKKSALCRVGFNDIVYKNNHLLLIWRYSV